MMGLAKPVAVVAHDAGAANIMLAWLGAEESAGTRAVMAGPAQELWHAKFGNTPLCESVDQALDGSAALLSGTGWAATIEHDARIAARERGIESIAVIDHWVNYRERFERDGVTVLPDRVWVTDLEALAIAQRTLPEVVAELKPNAYLQEQAAGAGPVPADGDLLFFAEPARADWGQGLPGEFQALEFLSSHAVLAGVPEDTPLRIRPHPSDPAGKYDDWLSRHPSATLDQSPDVSSALASARFAAGMNSAALAIALAAGRSTIVALPPAAPPCVLPHAGLLHLRDRV